MAVWTVKGKADIVFKSRAFMRIESCSVAEYVLQVSKWKTEVTYLFLRTVLAAKLDEI